jgi:hypothetical protein
VTADLPEAVRELLDGTALAAKVGTTLLLITSGRDGFPHLAVLSVGEVLATAKDELCLAIHAGSRTVAALREHKQALLATVVDGALYRHRLAVRVSSEVDTADGERDALFVADVLEVTEDRVPYARLTHGLEYELLDPSAVLPLWTQKVGQMEHAAMAASGPRQTGVGPVE